MKCLELAAVYTVKLTFRMRITGARTAACLQEEAVL